MNMDIVSSPEKLQELNSALAYLAELHTSGSADKPDVSESCMAAAMKIWLDKRAHIAQNIAADFKDLAKADAASEKAKAIKSCLTARIAAYNGLCLDYHLASPEAAISSTPKEGWLFERPPAAWRAELKKLKVFKPIDRDDLFFHGRVSKYTKLLSGLSKIDGDSLLIGTFASNIAVFFIYFLYYAACAEALKTVFFAAGSIFNVVIVSKFLIAKGTKKDA